MKTLIFLLLVISLSASGQQRKFKGVKKVVKRRQQQMVQPKTREDSLLIAEAVRKTIKDLKAMGLIK